MSNVMLAALLSLTMIAPYYAETEEEARVFALPERAVRVDSVAGTGSHGSRDGINAQFNIPFGVLAIDGETVLIIDTFNSLLRLASLGGHNDGDAVFSTQLFSGQLGDSDQYGFPVGGYRDGPLAEAKFNRPMGAAIDGEGRIFIADSQNHAIRVIYRGNLYTLAGDGTAGYRPSGAEGAGRFNHPSGVAVGPCGNVFVADSLNHLVRMVDMHGNVSTVAGVAGEFGFGDGQAGEALFNSPMGIAVGDDGTIYVADTGNHLIRKISDGYVTTLAGRFYMPDEVEWENEGGEFDYIPIGGYADGRNQDAMFNNPTGIQYVGGGILVADTANHAVRFVSFEGEAFTLAGGIGAGFRNGDVSEALFNLPRGLHFDGENLLVADSGNNVIRIVKFVAAGE